MSRSTYRGQLFLNDGLGHKLPIQTGTFVTNSVNIGEQRRLSLTVGIQGSTGVAGGGFTGVLQIQGTNELGACNGATGTQEAGNSQVPGTNGFTGGLFWNTIPGGNVNITNSTSSALVEFTDVGVAYVRVVFNQGSNAATGTLGGSGTMFVYLTAKNT